MLYDFFALHPASGTPLCRQLYTELRRGIESGRLRPGEKLASIRQAASELHLSHTTVETAYARLCLEGYARAIPQSGYRVQAALPKPAAGKPVAGFTPRYDFGTSSIDAGAADLQNWRRLMRAVLADEEAVVSYGDPQGENALRRALSFYAFGARGISADPENIFIGAGVGPLLHLLCSLFPDRPPVLMERFGFPQAQQIFQDYGFSVVTANLPQAEQIPEPLPKDPAALIMELPSLRPRSTPGMAAARRNALLKWVNASDSRYIIEDDYNGELRYKTRPIPAFQGGCPGKTIYLGSFSKLLLPSVRIAYMVLPPQLARPARARLATLNQTAGKTEQLALAEYIRTGFLEKHLRRLRRLYALKSQLMAETLENIFGGALSCTLQETSLSYMLTVPACCTGQKLQTLAREKGILCRAASPHSSAAPRVTLGFSGIPIDNIKPGIAALHEAWRMVLH